GRRVCRRHCQNQRCCLRKLQSGAPAQGPRAGTTFWRTFFGLPLGRVRCESNRVFAVGRAEQSQWTRRGWPTLCVPVTSKQRAFPAPPTWTVLDSPQISLRDGSGAL